MPGLSVSKGSLSPDQIFMSLTTGHKIIGRKNHRYHMQTCYSEDAFFHKPLIDHARTYCCRKVRFMVAYGYKNDRSEEQLERLRHELQNVGKEHHLRVVRTYCGVANDHEMLKVILSMHELPDDMWEKMETKVYDIRYE